MFDFEIKIIESIAIQKEHTLQRLEAFKYAL